MTDTDIVRIGMKNELVIILAIACGSFPAISFAENKNKSQVAEKNIKKISKLEQVKNQKHTDAELDVPVTIQKDMRPTEKKTGHAASDLSRP